MSAPNPKLREQIAGIVLDRLENDRLVLPALPAAASQCLNLMQDPDVAIKNIVQTPGGRAWDATGQMELSPDPALELTNSA